MPSIEKNINRLIEDFAILNKNKRYASAALLQFFALEEIGKMLLLSMGRNQKKLRHPHKQLAGICLSIGMVVKNKLDNLFLSLEIDPKFPPTWTQMDKSERSEFIKKMGDGKLKEWLDAGGPTEFLNIITGQQDKAKLASIDFFEGLRQMAAYVDVEKRKLAPELSNFNWENFDKAWVEDMNKILNAAQTALEHPQAIMIAISFFEKYEKSKRPTAH